MLALGLFACIAAIIKIPKLINYGKVGDFLWDSREITIWTATECNIGILAGSMPSLKPIFKPILGSSYVRGLTKKYGYGNAYGNSYGNGSKRHHDTNPKNFVSISSDPDKDSTFEAQSRLSQTALVDGNNNISLGSIQKTVVTTVEKGASGSSRELPPWHV